jgi:hypothetical protein
MRPALRPGDRLEVVAATGGSLRLGDLVALQGLGGDLIVHRFLGRRRGPRALLLTKGDASLVPDEPQPVTRLVGRIVRVHRSDGRCQDRRRAGWRVLDRFAGVVAWQVTLCGWFVRFVAGRAPARPGVPSSAPRGSVR